MTWTTSGRSTRSTRTSRPSPRRTQTCSGPTSTVRAPACRHASCPASHARAPSPCPLPAVNALQKGAEDLSKRLLRLKDLKGTSVYNAVTDEVNNFRESLPLIASLKNPAMKERHWDKISALTGVKIAANNPKAFTLGAIFAMNLSKYTEDVGEVVNEAKQELKIERDLRAITDKWAGTSFSVSKYVKNGEQRGFVLKVADEIKLELDDHLLNLQAMAGSRFVSSFVTQVSEWEKKLNLVTEAMDVWYVVQTKWQYLEGIFVGSEDIRQQLPEEAKRFGLVDKEWRAIMASTAKVGEGRGMGLP